MFISMYIFQMLQNPEEFNTAVQGLFSAQQQAILAGMCAIINYNLYLSMKSKNRCYAFNLQKIRYKQ